MRWLASTFTIDSGLYYGHFFLKLSSYLVKLGCYRPGGLSAPPAPQLQLGYF